MKKREPDDPPVACDLSTFDVVQSKRHEVLLSELLSSFQTTRELKDGYEFTLPGEDRWYLKLAEWVTLERQCCSFLTFEQGFNASGEVWLRLTGDDNAKQYLKTYGSSVLREKLGVAPNIPP